MPSQDERVTLLGVNQGGIVSLSDGSFWQIAPDHRKQVAAWRKGLPVELSENGDGVSYSHRLAYPNNGVSASVIPSSYLR